MHVKDTWRKEHDPISLDEWTTMHLAPKFVPDNCLDYRNCKAGIFSKAMVFIDFRLLSGLQSVLVIAYITSFIVE